MNESPESVKRVQPALAACGSRPTGPCPWRPWQIAGGFFAPLTLVVCAAWLSSPVHGQAAAQGAPQGKTAKVVRERTIYIPYKKLQETFEKEGRGIFLPYEEFLELWRAAQPKPPEPEPDKPPADAVIRGGKYTGAVTGDTVRFSVDFDINALKKGWSELPLPLEGVALESVEISSPSALFRTKGSQYSVLLPAPGSYHVKLQFSVRVQQEPGKKTISFKVPPVAVSRIELTIPQEGVRVDVRPTLAVTQTTTQEKATRVLAFLGNSSDLSVSWMPPVGELARGGAVLLAQQSIRAYLEERNLKIATDVEYQVLRGEVDSLRVRVPAQTRLLSVKGDNIREWSQEKDTLVVQLHSALKSAQASGGSRGATTASYRLALTFDRLLTETPSRLAIPFPAVESVIRESGWVIFGHDSGLNVRVQSSTGLSQLDKQEVPQALRSGLGVGFRYLAQPIALEVNVEKITPEIKSYTTSIVSLSKEEDSWVGWVDYQIARTGVFRFDLRVPSRWSIASVGDERSVDYSRKTDGADGTSTITVRLKSKALGKFRLPFRLVAEGSAAGKEAALSPPVIVGSRQDRGLFGVSAPKAISLSTVEKTKMLPADIDQLLRSGIMNQIGSEAGMPLTYSYREPGASVKVKLEAKKTEIDVLAQHLIEISDGGIKYTHVLDFQILYAAVDKLRFTAPRSLDGKLKVETGEKKELRKVSTDEDPSVWEVTLQAPALGPVAVTVSHEESLQGMEPGKPSVHAVPMVHATDVREKNGFVAVRKEGTLEITPEAQGMEPIDAGDLPDKLRRGQIYSAFRYFTQQPSLSLTLTRYEYQALATTVVNLLHLKSALSMERVLKTRAVLAVQNTERQYLEIQFPDEAHILSVTVDGKPQAPRKRKEGASTRLIQIPTSAGPDGTFKVSIVYDVPLATSAMGSLGGVGLSTPEILDGVPVNKVELELYLPPEYSYFGWGGNLHAKFSTRPGLWSRFKGLLDRTIAADNRQTPVTSQAVRKRPAAAQPETALDIKIPIRDLVRHDFDTLAPVGTLHFVYVGRMLYSLIDFLAFLLALVGGFLLLSKGRWKKRSVAVVVIFVPLALTWFTRGAIVEIFTSLLCGGVLVFLVLLARRVAAAFRSYRTARLALAPDPFLEEAAEPAAPEASPEPPDAQTPDGTEKPPADEKGEETSGGTDGTDDTDGKERS